MQNETEKITQSIASAGLHVDSLSIKAVLKNVSLALTYDAIVLEETAPIDTGCALLLELQQMDSAPPRLYLGAPQETDAIAQVYKLGVSNFIYRDTNDFYLHLLPQAILNCVRLYNKALTETRKIETLLNENNLLDQQNRELDAFSDSVAHDLKNPITHFLSYADFLRENHALLPDSEITAYMDVILRQSRKMHEIIDVLLLLARVRTGEDMELNQLNMSALVEAAMQQLGIDINKAHAQIEVPDSFPETVGYAPWIESVWINYLSNGLKYGGDPPRLTIGATDEDDGQVRFWLADSGPGLSDEDQALLFKPFPKIQRAKDKRGHGLGLSIVKRIVERLNGRVGVESTLGAGACFYFTLPRRQ